MGRVRDFVSAHGLLVYEGKYIVALSGGADSVALLCVMKDMCEEWGICIEAAHCNFHLRGEESMRDEQFCHDLCEKLSVPFHLVHFATEEYAELHHVSIEMAARELRYHYFEQLRCDINANGILVAHHRDDSVETVLLNLVRGTGIRGLRGIQPVNGRIVRPLLSVGRNDIITYLDAIGQSYVTDSTNLKNDVKRNKIRLDILPLLEAMNPSVRKSIADTALRVGEALKVYDDAMDSAFKDVVVEMPSDDNNVVCIDLQRVVDKPSPESVLFHILTKYGFSSTQVQQVYARLNGQSKVYESKTHELLLDRNRMIIQPLNYGVHTKYIRMPETGTYLYADDMRFVVVEEDVLSGYKPSRESMCICVDAELVMFPLTIRPALSADRFKPFGMRNSKLVSDYLTDRKRTLFDKRRQLVVVDASDRIVWLVGERCDDRFKITDATRKAIRITCSKS